MSEPTEFRSKSQAKRDMLALQALGERLVALSADRIGRVDLPEDLREAVLFAKTLKKREAWRRQMQYIGSLMRHTDPEPIRKALDRFDQGLGHDAALFHELEELRNGLVVDTNGFLGRILDRFPGADHGRLHDLAVRARKEKEENKAPKASRELFRYLRDLAEA